MFENCKIDNKVVLGGHYLDLNGIDYNVEFKNNKLDNVLVPFYFFNDIKGENNIAKKIELYFYSDNYDVGDLKFFFNLIFGNNYIEKLKDVGSKYIAWLNIFFKLKPKDCDCNFYDYINQKMKSVFKVKEIKIKFSNVFDDDFPEIIEFIGKQKKENIDKVLNFLKFKEEIVNFKK
jgi:hypothetical protein